MKVVLKKNDKTVYPVNLELAKSLKKQFDGSGISVVRGENCWYALKEGNAIFKTYGDMYYVRTKEFRRINELLCYELAKKMGVPCAKYLPAIKDKRQGNISFDVRKKGERLISYNSLIKYDSTNIEDMVVDLYEYCDKKLYVLDPNIENDLYKVVVFDTLTLQQDRHLNNIHMLYNKQNNFLYLSPLIDNEMSFGAKTLDLFNFNKEGIKWKDIMTDMEEEKSGTQYLTISKGTYTENIENIILCAQTDDEKYEILKRQWKNFNVAKAIKKVEEKGVEIPEKYKKYLFACERKVKSIFREYIKKIDAHSETQKIGLER